MKTIRDVMTTDVVWVSPAARVKSAVILMGKTGHNIGALPVVRGDDEVVGLITYQSVLGEAQDVSVTDVMERDFTTVEPEMSIREAADLMRERGAGHLLVTEEGHLVGIVSHGDVMTELGRNFDPLTDLPWSDAFREWAINALKRGMEISIILFDLDEFGQFNKRYGHVVGDSVLKNVAEALKGGIDPDRELLCRYAGDEFGIVSIRDADEAIALADSLKHKIAQIRIPDVPDGVSGTYGMAGGRRTKEREDTHYAATMDDLITRASKNCTANKPHRAEAAPAAPAQRAEETAAQAPGASAAPAEGRAARLKIQTINISTTETEVTIGVNLLRGGREYSRQVSGYAVGGKNILRLVAEATAGAACKSLASGHGIVVDEVIAQDTGAEEEIVTVVAIFISPRWSVKHAGSAVVRRGDRYRAVAAALLSAVNRQIENAPQAEPEQGEQSELQAEPRPDAAS